MPTEKPLYGEVWTTLTPTGVNIHAVIANTSMTEGPSYATGNVIVLVTATGQRIRLPPHGLSGWAFEAPSYVPRSHHVCSAMQCRRWPRFLVGESTPYCPTHLPRGVQSTIISEENDRPPTHPSSNPIRLGTCVFCGWGDIEATPLQVQFRDYLGFRSFRPDRHFNYSCPRCQAIYITAEIGTPVEDRNILHGASATGTTTLVCSLTGAVEDTGSIPLTRRDGVPEHLILLVSRMPRQVEALPQTEVPLPQIPAIGSQWVNRIDRSIVFVDRFSSPENPRAGAVHFRTAEPGTMAPMPFHDFLSYFSPLQERPVAPVVEIPCKPGEEWENRVGVYSDIYKIVETNAILGTVIVEDAAGQRRSIRAVEMARGWEKIVRVSVFDRLISEDFI